MSKKYTAKFLNEFISEGGLDSYHILDILKALGVKVCQDNISKVLQYNDRIVDFPYVNFDEIDLYYSNNDMSEDDYLNLRDEVEERCKKLRSKYSLTLPEIIEFIPDDKPKIKGRVVIDRGDFPFPTITLDESIEMLRPVEAENVIEEDEGERRARARDLERERILRRINGAD